MFGSEVLEIGIGMALLFFFMSLIATAACEVIENIMKSRATDLKKGIGEILTSWCASGKVADIEKKFFTHPLISSLYAGTYDPSKPHNLPSYIPRGHFAQAILDLAVSGELGKSVDALKASRDAGTASASDTFLLSIVETAATDAQAAQKKLEDWYDGTMDRVAGWYKRHSSYRLAVLGAVATVFLNVDAISIAQSLVTDTALRAAVVAQAEKATAPAGQTQTQPDQTVAQLSGALENIGYPMGWVWQDKIPYPKPQACSSATAPDTAGKPVVSIKCEGWALGVTQSIPGWVVTVLAVMLGAPFWFDVLNKLMVIRSTVKPKEKSQDEGSEDKAAPARKNTSATPPTVASEEPDPDEATSAAVAANLAVASNTFEPHEWKVKPNQEGIV